jgi:hypothetical protein
MPIPETIQLLGIDREYGESSLQKGFHHWPPWNLDRHRNGGRLAVRQVIQASQEVRDSPPGLVVAFSSGGRAVYCF